MTTFRFAYFALALAACSHPSAPQPPRAAAPPPKLDTLTRADFDARMADHRLHFISLERLPDASGDVGPLPDNPRLRVDGDVISTLSCRPGGASVELLSDDHYVYVHYEDTRLTPHAPPGSSYPLPPIATPSTYCSFVRFRIPAGLSYGGQLSVE